MKRNGLMLSTAVAMGVAALVAACGGGGGTGSTASTNGVMNVSLTDAPSDNFNHVWVTVKSISFHTDPNQSWDSKDATWNTVTLSSPVTIDLTQLNNGALQKVFSGISLPAGTYRQIRFFLASAEDALTASAQAASLQWNDQVQYTDSSGSTQNTALEIAYPTQGILLNGTFNVTAGSTLDLTVDFDLAHSVVPFKHDGLTAFTMRPVLQYYDMSKVGAIIGQVDKSKLCPAGTTPASSCAYNLIVKAELVDSSNTRHSVARATTVDPATGNFVLYPVAPKDASGNALSYDILIRGRNMDTVLVQKVPVTAGTTPTSSPTNLQSSGTIPVTVNASEYKAQFASALSPLTSGWAVFEETLPGTGQLPYSVRFGNTDPFTGLLLNPMALASGPIHLAQYNNGGTLSFGAVVPSEGQGGYSVATNEAAYYKLSSTTPIAAPSTAGSTVTFTPPVPTLASGLSNGSATANITVVNKGGYDHATLVIARFASIITTLDASSALTSSTSSASAASGASSTSSTGSTTSLAVSGLPAGSSAKPAPGAVYYAYLRVWKTGARKKALIVPFSGFIDLRSSNTASISLTSTTLN